MSIILGQNPRQNPPPYRHINWGAEGERSAGAGEQDRRVSEDWILEGGWGRVSEDWILEGGWGHKHLHPQSRSKGVGWHLEVAGWGGLLLRAVSKP